MHSRKSILLGLLFLAGALLTPGGFSWLPAPASGGTAHAAASDKLVLAFYYSWYGPGDFDRGQMCDKPLAPYISDHADVIKRQVSEAKASGIDAFISSWTGTGTETDANFPKLLEEARRQGFKATIYFETGFAMKRGDVLSQLKSALDRFAGDPAFLRWRGKPVVFFWSPQSYGNAVAWRDLRNRVDPGNNQIWSVDTTDVSYLDAFDTIHFFSGGKWGPSTDIGRVNAQWKGIVDAYNRAHGTARMFTPGVIPGWDESLVQPPRANAKVFPRRDGAMYEDGWKAARSINPDWVTITSYNEWFEGTQIEPSVSYNNLYLGLTRYQASEFKGNPDPCSGGPMFRQTGHAVCKQMESYWQRYGGVAQFGYPISDPLQEKSPTDGKQYTVQYFERAVFELHPEKQGTPYEVMLGLLGRRFHPPDPPAPARNGYTFFSETGHNVSGLFYEYWKSHGGLFVNGFPISEELTERGSDGKQYKVQYFERARFELHPENQPPYNVLLGMLGRQAWGSRGK